MDIFLLSLNTVFSCAKCAAARIDVRHVPVWIIVCSRHFIRHVLQFSFYTVIVSLIVLKKKKKTKTKTVEKKNPVKILSTYSFWIR